MPTEGERILEQLMQRYAGKHEVNVGAFSIQWDISQLDRVPPTRALLMQFGACYDGLRDKLRGIHDRAFMEGKLHEIASRWFATLDDG